MRPKKWNTSHLALTAAVIGATFAAINIWANETWLADKGIMAAFGSVVGSALLWAAVAAIVSSIRNLLARRS